MKTKTKTFLLIHRTFYSSPSIRMAYRQQKASSTPAAQQSHKQSTTPTPIAATASTFLTKLHEHAPNHPQQLMGFLTLAGILLLLTGITFTSTVLGLLFLSPVIIITSPIWVPIGALLIGFLSVGGFGASAVAGLSWLYRYLKGLHPPGSDRVDYARIRIADTASHMKDYAREYGSYLQNKVKDAAPGA